MSAGLRIEIHFCMYRLALVAALMWWKPLIAPAELLSGGRDWRQCIHSCELLSLWTRGKDCAKWSRGTMSRAGTSWTSSPSAHIVELQHNNFLITFFLKLITFFPDNFLSCLPYHRIQVSYRTIPLFSHVHWRNGGKGIVLSKVLHCMWRFDVHSLVFSKPAKARSTEQSYYRCGLRSSALWLG